MIQSFATFKKTSRVRNTKFGDLPKIYIRGKISLFVIRHDWHAVLVCLIKNIHMMYSDTKLIPE